MPWQPDYATLSQLKSYLRITDTADDVELGFAITAASRAIDHACNRQFGRTDTAVARTFPYVSDVPFEVDDIADLTGFALDTYTSADFTYRPYNAFARGLPITSLVPGDTVSLEEGDLTVTAIWGWPSVPTAITQATLIQASRFFKRRDAPFGVAGSVDLGSELRLLDRIDPDVRVVVEAYKRYWGVR